MSNICTKSLKNRILPRLTSCNTGNILNFCPRDLYDRSHFNDEEKEGALLNALKLCKPDFVELSTEFHFNFQNFLTIDRLYELYNESVHQSRVQNLCGKLGVTFDQNSGSELSALKKETFLKHLCAIERGLSFDDDYLTYREDGKDAVFLNCKIFRTRYKMSRV